MIDINHIPQSFSIAHKHKDSFVQIDFIFISGTSTPEWNGYYESHRILLRPMATEWVCEVLQYGIAQAIHRWPKSTVSLDDLKTLVGCACYYLDSLTNQNQ